VKQSADGDALHCQFVVELGGLARRRLRLTWLQSSIRLQQGCWCTEQGYNPQRTAPGQTLLDYTQTPPAPVVTLPAGFLGRNVPDISLNSDPDTGYVYW
jgi:hypothetical protein